MYKIEEIVNTKEKLVSALKTIKEIKILNEEEFLDLNNTYEFTRTLEVLVNETQYNIVWYHNYSSLVSEHVECNFDGIRLTSPTYPTVIGSKCKLQLLKNSRTVCVVG